MAMGLVAHFCDYFQVAQQGIGAFLNELLRRTRQAARESIHTNDHVTMAPRGT